MWEDEKMWKDVRRWEDEKMWKDEKMWEDEKMRRCEDEKIWEDVNMRRCDDRPPLLEEPFAQTLSGKIKNAPKSVLKLTSKTHLVILASSFPFRTPKNVKHHQPERFGGSAPGCAPRKDSVRFGLVPNSYRNWLDSVPRAIANSKTAQNSKSVIAGHGMFRVCLAGLFALWWCRLTFEAVCFSFRRFRHFRHFAGIGGCCGCVGGSVSLELFRFYCPGSTNEWRHLKHFAGICGNFGLVHGDLKRHLPPLALRVCRCAAFPLRWWGASQTRVFRILRVYRDVRYIYIYIY